MATNEPRIASFADCKLILDEVQSKSTDCSRIWHKGIAGQSLEHRLTAIRDQIDPERPYFLGQLSNGIQFAGDARDVPSALHAMYPNCNSTLIKALIEEIGDGAGDILDIGANIGIVSASLARYMGTRGHVHAFEPSPETFKLAAATIALNKLKNVTLSELAVGDFDGKINFQASPGNSAVASLRRHGFPFLNEWKEIIVSSRMIDTILREFSIEKVILMKVDVEGSELKVIRGARETIQRFKPTVVYEYTPVAAKSHGWTDVDSTSLLEELIPFQFEAVIEPPFDDQSSEARRVPFPLPHGISDQVNVFARVRQH